MYHYLLYQGKDLTTLISAWLRSILPGLKSKDASTLDRACNAKGRAGEVFLAHFLVLVSKELGGKPITNHPLFRKYEGTWLQDYCLEAGIST